MLVIIGVLSVVFLGFAGLLWAGTIFVQGYIYEAPNFSSLYWRSPAAAGAATLFLAFWCWLDYKAASPGRAELVYDTLFRFSYRENDPPKPYPKFTSINNRGKETLYERKASGQGTGGQYVDSQTKRPWDRSDAEGYVDRIVVEEEDRKVTFKVADMKDGKFLPGETRYLEDGGKNRVLIANEVRSGRCQSTVTRTGRLFVNLFLNFFLAAILFAGIWLLLQYQWKHALGFAVVLWIAMLFLIVPMVLSVVSDQAAKKVPAGTTTSAVKLRSL